MSERPDFQKLKSQVSLLTVAGRIGVEVFRGNKVRCCNRGRHKNGDKNPSVSLFLDQGSFYCWVCDDVRGDVIDFARMFGNLDWRGAVELLQSCGGTSAGDGPAPAALPSRSTAPRILEDHHIEAMEALMRFSDPLDTACRSYLESRCINPDLAEKAGVRCLVSAPHTKTRLLEALGQNHPGLPAVLSERGNLRFHMHRLLFPYRDPEGLVVYIQGRDIYGKSEWKEVATKVPITVPWVLPDAFDHEVIFLGEGVIDALTLYSMGQSVVGLPGARTWQAHWADFFQGYRVVPALDGDPAGRAGTRDILASLAGKAAATYDMQVPDGMDVNSLAKAGLLSPAVDSARQSIRSIAC